MTAANLHNEDDSYTHSIAPKTFYNVNGRWFVDGSHNERVNHTYLFTYISDGTDIETPAVYGADKTGLAAGYKWSNVESDSTCTDIWNSTQALNNYGVGQVSYIWRNNAWLQLLNTETENIYSGSDGNLYTKEDCNIVSSAVVDENCLYMIDGVKKALVDGKYIELIVNTEDAAYHDKNNVGNYYIAFEGCVWHPATKITGKEKAYMVEEYSYIWLNDMWTLAYQENDFFYIIDDQNVKVYYMYKDGEWVKAEPYVCVTSVAETRTFFNLNDAFSVASIWSNATITILKDISNVTTSCVYTGRYGATLDLNGHIVEGGIAKLIDVNAIGSLTIVDNTADQKGEIRACPSANSRQTGFIVTKGTLTLKSGKMYATNAMERQSSGNTNVRINGLVVEKDAVFNMTGGEVECVDEYNNYGIQVNGNATTKGVANISGGKVIVHATILDSPFGVLVNYGRLNLSGSGYIECVAEKSSSAYGVSVQATASYDETKGTGYAYGGEFNMTGGKIYAKAYTNESRGVQVNRGVAIKSIKTPDRTIMYEFDAMASISGGTITAESESGTTPYGVLSYGNTIITGGTITAKVLQSDKSTSFGIRVNGGVTTIKDNVVIISEAPTKAYGVSVSASVDWNYGRWTHEGTLNVEGGSITAVSTTKNIAMGVYVTGTTRNINLAADNTYAALNGDYAGAGTVNVSGGMFNADAYTTSAYGVYVDATKKLNDVSATPKAMVTGGKFKMAGTGTLCASNDAAETTDLQIMGGLYSHNKNLDKYVLQPQYKVFDNNDDTYKYIVADMVGSPLDITDWTDNTLTINATGFIPLWPYTINNQTFALTDLNPDRTATIGYTGKPDDLIRIEVTNSKGKVISSRKYRIPHIITSDVTLSGTDEESIVFVKEGATLTIAENTTLAAIYVAQGAELVVNSGVVLTANSLILRTTPWAAASLDNNGTIYTKVYYTRIVSDRAYHQFALPLSTTISGAFLSNGAKFPYESTWLLKRYDERSRAENGANDNGTNWVPLSSNDPIVATTGYELYSGSAYYREIYFPVDITQSVGKTVSVSHTDGAAGAAHAGWNAICSPLLGKYQQTFNDASDAIKVSELTEDGNYWQHIPETIRPAVPFYYQAPKTGALDFSGKELAQNAPRRAWHTSVSTQWLRLMLNDAKGKMLDETDIFLHPEKFSVDYESGYDVIKQSTTGGKALLYSELAYGASAFAALPDSVAESRIPLTVYAAETKPYTFHLEDNVYLNRLSNVFLRDTETGAVIDLLTSDYEATLYEGTTRGRFYITCVFRAPNITTDVETTVQDKQTDPIQKVFYNGKVYILRNGIVYDLTGRQCEMK